MHILVTGGCGFIGSNLCRKLLGEGHHVICLDNLSSGKLGNVSDLQNNCNFELIRHDVVEPILLEVEQIYHLACPASPKFYQKNPIKTIKTNVLGTMNMLGLAKRVNARILLSSTSEIYGDPLENPQTESYFGNVNPNGIRACYDEGKRVAETLMFEYNRQHNVDIRVARIFNTYGPGMDIDDGRVVCNFIKQALNGDIITVYGEGDQTRSLCYIDDMVEGLITLMNTKIGVNNPINLGNDSEYTILNIANLVKKKINCNSNIHFGVLPKDDPKKRKPDLELAKTVLSWEAKISFEDGLDRSIEWYRDILLKRIVD